MDKLLLKERKQQELITEEELKHCDSMIQEDWEREYKYASNFKTQLMRLLEIADIINLKKLSTIYPNMTKALLEFRKE